MSSDSVDEYEQKQFCWTEKCERELRRIDEVVYRCDKCVEDYLLCECGVLEGAECFKGNVCDYCGVFWCCMCHDREGSVEEDDEQGWIYVCHVCQK